jgi:RNA polymerase sigma-70 factor (ECF subfamily)
MRPAVIPAAPMALSDLETARRIEAGDRAVLVALMRQHNQRLYRAARSILRDDADAEDAVQEAYLQAFRAIGQFRGDSRLSTWLTRIAINTALARRRQRVRQAEVVWLDADPAADAEVAMTIDPSQEDPARAAARAELRALIESRIDRLPEAFRTVFVLRGVEELSVEETAACWASRRRRYGPGSSARGPCCANRWRATSTPASTAPSASPASVATGSSPACWPASRRRSGRRARTAPPSA